MLLPRLYPIVDLGCFRAAADPVIAASRFAEDLLRGGATLIQYRDKSSNPRRFLSCARELRRITRGRALLIVNDRVDLCLAAEADGVHLGQDDLSPAAARRIFDSVGSHPFASKLETTAQIFSERVGHPHADTPSVTAPNPALSPESSVECSAVVAWGARASTESIGSTKSIKSGGSREHLVIGFSTHNPEQVREADPQPVDYIAVGPVFATASKANPDPVIGLEGVRRARAATAKPLVAIGGITRQNCRQVVEAGADSVAVISDLLESPVKALEEFLSILG